VFPLQQPAMQFTLVQEPGAGVVQARPIGVAVHSSLGVQV
jgi:hypothetical protein